MAVDESSIIRINPVTPKWWGILEARCAEMPPAPPSPPRDATLKERRRFYKQTYLDQIKLATPSWADKAAIKALYQDSAKRNRVARGWGVSDKRKKNRLVTFSVDHFFPLRGAHVCGLHVIANLRIVRVSHNSRKSNRVEEFHQDCDTGMVL